ncbi:Alpha/Beta hydrolase protein [Mycena sp. CBHHK59/15]|nr:Alpha/Beta hydrolase protein [Mycena sp. CBHHK59/15]
MVEAETPAKSRFCVDSSSTRSRSLWRRATWTVFADGTVMVCHHGAGYSGLSFACLAKEIGDMSKGECGVLALDARRHGKTKTTAAKEDEDLSISVLVEDFVQILQAVYLDPATAPTLLLVSHSMGGAVVVRACPQLLERKFRISGVAVLDVVEGSAMEALPHMHNLLNVRPDGFDSPEAAIKWHVKTKTIRNANSARVSVSAIVVPAATPPPPDRARVPVAHAAALDGAVLVEYARPPPLLRAATEMPRAPGWFTGLSGAFLAPRTARLLLLAGTDRLDRELMIAQMQGKFQMIVVNGVGHMLHEDDPTHVAEILLDFWRRND